MKQIAPDASIEAAAQRVFGISTLRAGQREAVAALCAGGDALVIMPSGAGKSLIYQLAPLLIEGTALVVSPLIALMREQSERLRDLGYTGVAALHS